MNGPRPECGPYWCLATAGLLLVAESALDGTTKHVMPDARTQAKAFIRGVFSAASQGGMNCERLRVMLERDRGDARLMPLLLDAVMAAGPEAISALWLGLLDRRGRSCGDGNDSNLTRAAIAAMDSDVFHR